MDLITEPTELIDFKEDLNRKLKGINPTQQAPRALSIIFVNSPEFQGNDQSQQESCKWHP